MTAGEDRRTSAVELLWDRRAVHSPGADASRKGQASWAAIAGSALAVLSESSARANPADAVSGQPAG